MPETRTGDKLHMLVERCLLYIHLARVSWGAIGI